LKPKEELKQNVFPGTGLDLRTGRDFNGQGRPSPVSAPKAPVSAPKAPVSVPQAFDGDGRPTTFRIKDYFAREE